MPSVGTHEDCTLVAFELRDQSELQGPDTSCAPMLARIAAVQAQRSQSAQHHAQHASVRLQIYLRSATDGAARGLEGVTGPRGKLCFMLASEACEHSPAQSCTGTSRLHASAAADAVSGRT